jgi:hypothetical protein
MDGPQLYTIDPSGVAYVILNIFLTTIFCSCILSIIFLAFFHFANMLDQLWREALK